ncbi:MAG: sugar phosphate isomerase/epimerase [Planctomycetes bacterium]|nr:sugar phosphate isomerase/epimerase [Planctomycetota bacterium]
MITISAFADEIGPDLKVQMDVCESLGVKCIDVRAIDGKNVSLFTVAEARQYSKRMDDRGFKMPCVGSPIGKIKISDDFNAHLDLLKHCFDLAEAFKTKQIRIFSFYASEGKNILDERADVMKRMEAMVKAAEAAKMILLHENERNIYGAFPDGVKDIFATIKSPNLKGVFDPANFAIDGVHPYDDGWTKGLDKLTHYFHIKDAKLNAHGPCVPAGQGDGQIDRIFADLAKKKWEGVMTLEPHMKAAEQFAGFTGPQLFGKAVEGLKTLLDKAGLKYE